MLVACSRRRASRKADAVADFYRGKTVNVLIGVGVGGEYDIQARLVARHIGKHIPGNPTVVAQNMTGAGGLRMINYLYNVAAKDGTYIGMIANAFPAHAGGRRARRAVRRRQDAMDRHDRAGQRDHGGVAHHRREDASTTPASARSSPAPRRAAPSPSSIRR